MSRSIPIAVYLLAMSPYGFGVVQELTKSRHERVLTGDDAAKAEDLTSVDLRILSGKRPGLEGPMPKAAALTEAKRWLRELSAEQVSALTAAATNGVVRRNRGDKEVTLVDRPKEPAQPVPKGETVC